MRRFRSQVLGKFIQEWIVPHLIKILAVILCDYLKFLLQSKRFIPTMPDERKKIGYGSAIAKFVLPVGNKSMLFKILQKLWVDVFLHCSWDDKKKSNRPGIEWHGFRTFFGNRMNSGYFSLTKENISIIADMEETR